MKYLQIVALIIISMVFGACQKSMIRGKGDNITQARSVAPFSSAQVNGEIEMYIVKGAMQKVDIQGYSNLVDIIETNVVNNRLVVKFKDEFFNIRNNNIRVNVTIPGLDGVATNGSGKITAEGFNNGLTIGASINGSSRMTINNSSYDNAELSVNGSGQINAAGLSAKNVNTTIQGSGNIETTCLQTLKGSISGSGNVKYWGEPAVDIKISGSGRVKKQ